MAVNIFNFLKAEKIRLEESLKAYRDEEKPVEEDSKYLDYLKKLKLDFTKGKFPPYEILDIQRFYFLRYGFGYSYGYKCMYNEILKRDKDNNRFREKIEVFSIGCGAGLDYIGLQYALEEVGYENCSITYIGIEPVTWSEAVYPQSDDIVSIYQYRIEDYLTPLIDLTSDVIIFPASISEVPVSYAEDPGNIEFKKLCTILAPKLRKDDIYIMTSIRKKNGIDPDDLARVEVIKDVMEKNGFELKEEISEPDMGIKQAISFPDPDNPGEMKEYPDRIYNFMLGLCYSCEDLKDQKPMKFKDIICYRVLHFVRAK